MPFFPRHAQMPVAMLVCLACLVVILLLVLRPFHRKADNRLIMLSQSEIFLLMLAAHIFIRDKILDDRDDVLLSVFLIALMLGFSVLFIAQLYHVLRKLCFRKCVQPNKAAVGSSIPSSGSSDDLRKAFIERRMAEAEKILKERALRTSQASQASS